VGSAILLLEPSYVNNTLHTYTKHRIGFDFIWSEKHPNWILCHLKCETPNWIWLHLKWETSNWVLHHLKCETPNWILHHLKCKTPQLDLISFEVRNIQLDFTSFEMLKHPIGFHIIWNAKTPNCIWLHLKC
jgi:hypothetical protein